MKKIEAEDFYQFILGLFFLIAGIGKMLDTFSFGELMYDYGFGQFYWLSPIFASLEVYLGSMLLLSIYTKSAVRISFMLLCVFTIAFGYAYLNKGIENCGCLGTVLDTKVPAYLSFLRNFLLMGICLVLWNKQANKTSKILQYKKYSLLFIGITTIVVSGFNFKVPSLKDKKRHIFEGESISKTPLSKVVQFHKDSTYLVFIFTYQCPYCLQSIENLKKYETQGLSQKIICISPKTSERIRTEFLSNAQFDLPIYELETQEFLKIGKSVPAILYIKNNKIQAGRLGKLLSPFAFEQLYL